MQFRRLGIALVLGLMATWAQAQVALVESVTGKATVRGPNQSAVLPMAVGQAIQEGSEITTDSGASSILRFTDGQKLAVSENSLARITAYRYDTAKPENSTTLLELTRGALRSVSGWIGSRNPAGVRVATATSTIGIRGTDFMVAATETATHTQVVSGEIGVTSPGGSVNVAAGSTATAAAGQAPVIVPASSLPASVGASFNQLGALQLAAAAPGAASATAGAVGGVTGAGIAAAAIAVGALAAAGGGGGGDSGTTGTTGTTGTR
jgi:hypothetical protein